MQTCDTRPAPEAPATAPSTGKAGAVRSRAIGSADTDAVVALLVEGFPSRTEQHWRRGIARHLARPLPDGLPRLGYVLESEGRLVGVLLTLCSTRRQDGETRLVCNLSSWYVQPAFRGYAGWLDNVGTRRKDVTYFNISAVRRTWPMHEARGFQRYCRGEFVSVPLLSRRRPGVRIRSVEEAGDELSEDDRRLLADHARFGCVCLVATDERGSEPLVFMRRSAEVIRQRFGWSPLTYFQLVYCRSTADLPRFAHALGRYLLRHHAMPWIVVDALGPLAGLPGRFIERWGTKFARGPSPMRNGDLSYTELVLFGE